MSALIGWALPYLIAAAAAVLGIWRLWAGGKKAGKNEAKAKEADAYERHLEEIADAHRARNSVRPDGLPDADKYRRD